jgi:hypothetical protein
VIADWVALYARPGAPGEMVRLRSSPAPCANVPSSVRYGPEIGSWPSRQLRLFHDPDLSFMGTMVNGWVGWIPVLCRDRRQRRGCVHGGRSRSLGRCLNADVRPRRAVSIQTSATGRSKPSRSACGIPPQEEWNRAIRVRGAQSFRTGSPTLTSRASQSGCKLFNVRVTRPTVRYSMARRRSSKAERASWISPAQECPQTRDRRIQPARPLMIC